MQIHNTSQKIDFIIAGAQKSGTSALDSYLRKHPEVGMGQRKEIHFFDNENVFSKPKVEYSKYEKFFDFHSNKKIYGEATPIYLYWEKSCQRIWKYNPNIKLIFILRNPIDRAFSHWNMEYGREKDSETFSYAIRHEAQRVKESLPLQHRNYSYLERGFYSKQILRFKKYFDNKQLMFIKYEEFDTQQENVLIEIFDFLKVDKSKFLFERKTVHQLKKHAQMSEEDKEYLVQKFEDDIHQVERILKWDCSDWLI